MYPHVFITSRNLRIHCECECRFTRFFCQSRQQHAKRSQNSCRPLFQGGSKSRYSSKCASIVRLITSSNIDQFSKFFHHQNQEKICNSTNTKDPTAHQVCRYTTLCNVCVLIATTENKTISITTHFKSASTVVSGMHSRSI